MSNVISIVVPQETRERALNLRMNISKVCREALIVAVEKGEKERGIAAKQTPRTPSRLKEANELCRQK